MNTIVTSVRNEARYILEWIAYHKSIGFDYFIFYTNDNSDETLDILKKIQKTGIIEVHENIINPGDSPQKKAFKSAFQRLKEIRPKWVCCIDVDEYLILHKHDSINDLLLDYKDNDALAINWLHYGSSNEDSYINKPIIERFKHCSNQNHPLNKMVKSIFKFNDKKIFGFGPHRPWFKDNLNPKYTYLNKANVEHDFWKLGVNLMNLDNVSIDHSVASIHHYAVKSKEEYKEKKERGNGMQPNSNKNHFKDDYFKLRDRNEELGVNLDKEIKKTKYFMRQILTKITETPKKISMKEVKTLREAALILENQNIEISKEILKIALESNPKGEFIKSRINLYSLIDNEKQKTK